MAVFAMPRLAMTSFSKRIEHVAQFAVGSPVAGTTDAVDLGPFLWRGRCAWKVRTETEFRQLSAIAALLKGQANQLRIPLPAKYQNALPAGVAVSSSGMQVLDDGRVWASIAATGDAWRPVPGTHLNIGNRLYIVMADLGSGTYSIEPRYVLESAQFPIEVEAARPFVVVEASTQGQLRESLIGWRTDRVTLEWVEAAVADDLGRTVPHEPVEVRAVGVSGDTVRTTWDAPLIDGGAPVIGYRLQTSDDGEVWRTLAEPALRGHYDTRAGTFAAFYRVAARNIIGYGHYSEPVRGETVAADVDDSGFSRGFSLGFRA